MNSPKISVCTIHYSSISINFFRENVDLIIFLKIQKFRKEFKIKKLKLKYAATTQFNLHCGVKLIQFIFFQI